ncbi:MAG: hydrogenobyrinic acid a,c-diamide synthase (glutamine-hydrolyzing) [Anaerolineae bacterium]
MNKLFTPHSSLRAPNGPEQSPPTGLHRGKAPLGASSQSTNLPVSQSTNRLVIAAPQGRSGKTTLALGLCAALAARGLAVQPFKKGPDYIDPSWLTEAAGRACRTLDPFFLISEDEVRRAFLRGARGADISLIEGNHGLYDSLDDEGSGSTAAVARSLQAPIILVVNAARMSRSVAALVRGYQTFEPGTPIAAVVLNNVAPSTPHRAQSTPYGAHSTPYGAHSTPSGAYSTPSGAQSTPSGAHSTPSGAHGRHECKLRNAIERHCHLPVVGALPRSDLLTIPDRHLGLVPRAEDDALIPAIEACRNAVEQYLDLDAVLDIARSAPPIPGWQEWPGGAGADLAAARLPHSPIARVGVVRDRAFSFYYPENLEALMDAGAELIFVDALRDSHLPDMDALYIGGGFPEIFMQELSANRRLRRDIQAAAKGGLPIYAECGGLMYLSRCIIWGDRSAEMVGALPCEVEVTGRPQGHGYVIGEALEGNPFLPAGTIVRGHEFHHSRIVNWQGELSTAYRLQRGNGLGDGRDGLVYRNILAAYTHLHAAGSPGWAQGVLARARAYANEVTHAPV